MSFEAFDLLDIIINDVIVFADRVQSKNKILFGK